MLPNFFVIGANKAGTSSLHRYLGQHPDIFMSRIKEPYFFAHEGELPPDTPFRKQMEAASTREQYEALFAAAEGAIAVGESSTGYLPNAIAARRIHEEIPDARLIAILRDPSDRAHSAFAHARREGKEPLRDFEAAIDAELSGCRWRSYVALGRYSQGLTNYFERFPASQLKILLYDEYSDEPVAVLREIFGWLGVDPTFTPDVSRRFNVSYIPKSDAVSSALRRPSPLRSLARAGVPMSARRWLQRKAVRLNSARPEPLDPPTRARLVELFDADIRRTEALLGRDLSSWRTVDTRA
jgi:hypothetical protein